MPKPMATTIFVQAALVALLVVTAIGRVSASSDRTNEES